MTKSRDGGIIPSAGLKKASGFAEEPGAMIIHIGCLLFRERSLLKNCR